MISKQTLLASLNCEFVRLNEPPICSFTSISALDEDDLEIETSSAIKLPPLYEIAGDASSSVVPDK